MRLLFAIARPRGQIYTPHQARTDGAITVLCVWSTSTELENTMSASLSACACGHLQSSPRARHGRICMDGCQRWHHWHWQLRSRTALAGSWPLVLAGPGAPAGVDHVDGSWLRACMLRFMPTQGAVSHGACAHAAAVQERAARRARVRSARFLKVRTDRTKNLEERTVQTRRSTRTRTVVILG